MDQGLAVSRYPMGELNGVSQWSVSPSQGVPVMAIHQFLCRVFLCLVPTVTALGEAQSIDDPQASDPYWMQMALHHKEKQRQVTRSNN